MSTARNVALDALVACEKQGAWSDGYLKKAIKAAELDGRDAALATRLCFGVLQNRMLLDFYLSQLCTTRLEKLEAPIRNLLRLGAYQILYLDRVPDHAAVSETVSLARKKVKNPRAAGLVNGVLRSLVRQKDSLPEPPDPATRYSHPQWLADEFTRRLGGEEAEALLSADNREPPTCAQVNTLKTTAEALSAALRERGVDVQPHPWLPNCLLLRHTGSLEGLEEFQQGLFYIQDAAARLAVTAADPRPGMRVLDACAAPGGKSFAAAFQMEDRGGIVACDLHENKLKRIREGAERLGLTCIRTEAADGRVFRPEWEDAFDAVLVDAPCSGLGIIRKKPDIRYKRPDDLFALPVIQRAILDNAARYVKPGGTLVYSTCTILPEENQEVTDGFLAEHPDFVRTPFALPDPVGETEGQVTLWPHRHGTDGFYICRMARQP